MSVSYMHMRAMCLMGWLRLVGSMKLYVSFAEYSFFYNALVHKRPVILSIILTEATPQWGNYWVCLRNRELLGWFAESTRFLCDMTQDMRCVCVCVCVCACVCGGVCSVYKWATKHWGTFMNVIYIFIQVDGFIYVDT